MASLVTIHHVSHHVLRLSASHLAPLLSLLSLVTVLSLCHSLSPSVVSGLADYQLISDLSGQSLAPAPVLRTAQHTRPHRTML